jgi:hypothetical protein
MTIHFHPFRFFESWAGAFGGWTVRTGADDVGNCVGVPCIDARDGSVCGGGVETAPSAVAGFVRSSPLSAFWANAAGSNRVIESARRRLTHAAPLHLALGRISSSFRGTSIPDLTRGNCPPNPLMNPEQFCGRSANAPNLLARFGVMYIEETMVDVPEWLPVLGQKLPVAEPPHVCGSP